MKYKSKTPPGNIRTSMNDGVRAKPFNPSDNFMPALYASPPVGFERKYFNPVKTEKIPNQKNRLFWIVLGVGILICAILSYILIANIIVMR